MSESKNLIQPEIDYKDSYEKLQVKYRILEKEYILFMEFMKKTMESTIENQKELLKNQEKYIANLKTT
jgi:hypothetical protein